MKGLFLKLLIVLFIAGQAYAFAPSVVVHIGQYNVVGDKVADITTAIENAVLDVLYDSGSIVSGVPVSMNIADSVNIDNAIDEAIKGYMSYIVYISVVYNETQSNDFMHFAFDNIKSVHWQIIRAKDGLCVYEEESIIPKKKNDETDSFVIQNFSQQLGFDIQEALSNS
ncbi:MAG: hypothetical protein R3Y36_06475 [Spirochaetales bacterium]